MRDAAGERMLHDGEADQHHDQHQAAEQGRADDVIGGGAKILSAAAMVHTTSSSQVGIRRAARNQEPRCVER